MSTLQISKEFQASKEQLFAAWTDPAELKQWWKPLGRQLVQVENNLAPGGTVKYIFEDDHLAIHGIYEKVVDHKLLEYTWNWHVKAGSVNDAAYKLSIAFEGDQQRSRVSITQEGFESEDHIHPHQEGWEKALEDLQQYLEGGGGRGRLAEAEKQK